MLSSHKALARELNELETKYDQQFAVVFDAIRTLMETPPAAKKRRIEFIIEDRYRADRNSHHVM
jgi:hypothetical protein